MGNSRALFASIGVSISLVAAAALSLFAVSVVIAFGGWSAGLGESAPATVLVFGPTSKGTVTTDVKAAAAAREPVVFRAPAKARPQRSGGAQTAGTAKAGSATDSRIISHSVTGVSVQQPIILPPTSVSAAPARHMPSTGDGVRRVGDDLSSTAHSTGKALADVTAPLGPPVSSAVQKVLDLVAVLLNRATNGLGNTLDAVGSR